MNDLRERFIEDIKRIWGEKTLPDLSLVQSGQPNSSGKAGSFKDKGVHKMWQGYLLAHGANHHEIAVDNRHLHMGTYVVGRVDGKKQIFSRAPHRHLHRKLAEVEAQRLVKEHGFEFGIWRCVNVVTPDPVVTE